MSAGAAAAGPLLSTAAPPIAIEEAEAFAAAAFGVAGTLTLLSGERDQNFHLGTPGGAEYVLKVAHPAEPSSVAASQRKKPHPLRLRLIPIRRRC